MSALHLDRTAAAMSELAERIVAAMAKATKLLGDPVDNPTADDLRVYIAGLDAFRDAGEAMVAAGGQAMGFAAACREVVASRLAKAPA